MLLRGMYGLTDRMKGFVSGMYGFTNRMQGFVRGMYGLTDRTQGFGREMIGITYRMYEMSFHSPRLSPAQYSLTVTESCPKQHSFLAQTGTFLVQHY